jgi:hypothetical protein
VEIRKPNQLAQSALDRAADLYDKVADAYEANAKKWREFTAKLREGDVLAAKEVSKTFANIGQLKDEASQMAQTVAILDHEWWVKIEEHEMREEVKAMTPRDAQNILVLHKLTCSNKDCRFEKHLVARAADEQ